MSDRDEPTVAGWGNLAVPGHEVLSEDLERATSDAVLSRGLGRSYGDSSLPPPSRREVVGTRLADRILHWDGRTGLLRAEAGFSLWEFNRLFLRRGWFIGSTPGTQFVTLGGMVASDVHGKGHHSHGCFGSRHVRSLRMRVPSGELVECSPERDPELFWATIGGMGLTGHILEVECQTQAIPSPWIWSESERVDDIDQFIDGLKEAGKTWPFTVGWIDCLSRGKHMGRGLLDRGRWATPEETGGRPLPVTRRLTLPFMFPEWVLRWKLTTQAFNTMWYWRHVPRVKKKLCHPDSFFYPLDAILRWNRIYGRRGFTQYQCVLPDEAGRGAARRFLDLLTRRGGASFLCVIKDAAAEGQGMLSFLRPGISIAVDFAVRDDTQKLIDALNELVIAEGGRIYLSKDAFTRPEHYAAMDPRLPQFLAVRDRIDPERTIRSAQSVRMFGDPP
ncbi:FAD-binding oxidoreductase [Nannocystis sp. ILAH1]|uniref:FAD-binding protein n=1 Tax=unclassified Nannocystis TaxID=2627009 RepID=UPI0022717340|nr:FAD-binding oxidoreductase [Nannocystis sp. ILAH1]MCY1068378.1 FAD-binding oxidoreductase [Nannocystis sp. RBIL2]